jgi:hypothetical protein
MTVDWSDVEHAQLVYTQSVFWTSTILTLMYGVIIVKVYTGSKYTLIIVLTIMLLVSNIAAVLSDDFAKKYSNTTDVAWLVFECIATWLRDMFFNLAHWVFCYKYWLISIDVEAVFTGVEKKPKNVNAVMIGLDIVMPLVYTTCFGVMALKYPNNVANPVQPPTWLLGTYLVSAYSKGVLLLIAAWYLADSMRRIRHFVKGEQLN